MQNGLSRACLGAAPPLPRPGGGCRTAYRIAKLSEDGPRFQPIATDRQIYAPTLYLEDTTASFNGYGWEDICLDS